MANKHVLNPCINSGAQVPDTESWLTANGVRKAYCKACNVKVTVNKKNRSFRKHKAVVNESV